MKAQYYLAIFTIGSVILSSGCSDESSTANADASGETPSGQAEVINTIPKNEQMQLLAAGLTTVLDTQIDYANQNSPDYEASMKAINALKTLKELAGQEFLAPIPKDFDRTTPRGVALSKYQTMMPFYVEDFSTNTYYIAPQSVQEQIIASWRGFIQRNQSSSTGGSAAAGSLLE